MESDTKHTVGSIFDKSVAFLVKHGIESPDIAAGLLLARLLHCRRLELAMKRALPLRLAQVEAMRRGLARLAAGEPVQYILGVTEFMGHVVKVDRRALIPRPETEQLVSTVLECSDLWQSGDVRIADVGTGSGCIALSILKAQPAARVLALDVSADALALARENAALNHVDQEIVFACAEMADVLEPETLDAVVSNPPYVRSADWEKLAPQVRDYEPRLALDGGSSGLDVLEAVIADAMIALRADGWLFLEIGAGQAAAVNDILRGCDYHSVRINRDLAGYERIVSARRYA